MKRDIFEPEHLVFRDTVRQFLTRNVLPHHASWEQAGIVERWVWKAAAEQGLLGLQAEEAYGGGGGIDDFRFNVILDEEIARSGATGLTFGLQNDIVGPYLYSLATREQKERWLPGVCRGETILAVAMSEPNAGSDLQGITTAAVRDGDHRCVELHVRGELTAVEAAMAKWWTTELHKKVVDACVQLHGGYGYMLEYPIARAYLDTRVETIFGGTTEIMKEIIGRSLGL